MKNRTCTKFTLPCLTSIIETLEYFQDFESKVKATAIALYAAELGINKLHFYTIAHHAGLLGGV